MNRTDVCVNPLIQRCLLMTLEWSLLFQLKVVVHDIPAQSSPGIHSKPVSMHLTKPVWSISSVTSPGWPWPNTSCVVQSWGIEAWCCGKRISSFSTKRFGWGPSSNSDETTQATLHEASRHPCRSKWSENYPNCPMAGSNWSWNNQSLEYLLLLVRILDGF